MQPLKDKIDQRALIYNIQQDTIIWWKANCKKRTQSMTLYEVVCEWIYAHICIMNLNIFRSTFSTILHLPAQEAGPYGHSNGLPCLVAAGWI